MPHDGVPISSVMANSPAADAGLQEGDFVTAVNDHYVTTANDLTSELLKYPAGSEVTIRYRHSSMILDMTIILTACSGGI